MPRMRSDDVGAIAAVLIHAQAARRDAAHIVFFSKAFFAFAAAKPGEDDPQVADLDARGVGTKLDHPADNFMSHRQRQNHATIDQRHHLATAEVIVTFPDMQVGVADAAMRDLKQDLGARRLRRRQLDLL